MPHRTYHSNHLMHETPSGCLQGFFVKRIGAGTHYRIDSDIF